MVTKILIVLLNFLGTTFLNFNVDQQSGILEPKSQIAIKSKDSEDKNKDKICASYLFLSGSSPSDSWVITKVGFENTNSSGEDVWSREINTVMYQGLEDQGFGFGSGNYNISIKLYEDNDPPTSGYLVLSNYVTGNVIDCKPILFGTNTYTFTNVYGGCQVFKVSILPTC